MMELEIRQFVRTDAEAWRPLWNAYCEFYRTQLDEATIETLWSRILDPLCKVGGIGAFDPASGAMLGFTHFVLHPHTWSTQELCYLEDLYVVPESRGKSVGHALITYLRERARAEKWRRVYWHTETDNLRARRLYDRFKPADEFVRYTIQDEKT